MMIIYWQKSIFHKRSWQLVLAKDPLWALNDKMMDPIQRLRAAKPQQLICTFKINCIVDGKQTWIPASNPSNQSLYLRFENQCPSLDYHRHKRKATKWFHIIWSGSHSVVLQQISDCRSYANPILCWKGSLQTNGMGHMAHSQASYERSSNPKSRIAFIKTDMAKNPIMIKIVKTNYNNLNTWW